MAGSVHHPEGGPRLESRASRLTERERAHTARIRIPPEDLKASPLFGTGTIEAGNADQVEGASRGMAEGLPDLYPLPTEPVYRHYVWGGTRLSELLGKPVGPQGTLAESWEIGDDARVAEGAWQGKTLREVDEATDGGISNGAPHYPSARLPMLIKLSGSAQDLSVQIHPSDEQALRDDPGRGFPGKTEMYLILDAEPGRGRLLGPALRRHGRSPARGVPHRQWSARPDQLRPGESRGRPLFARRRRTRPGQGHRILRGAAEFGHHLSTLRLGSGRRRRKAQAATSGPGHGSARPQQTA